MAKLPEPAVDELEEAGASVPQIDPVLGETERILADYAAISYAPASLAVTAH
jgi:hypothetical protein